GPSPAELEILAGAAIRARPLDRVQRAHLRASQRSLATRRKRSGAIAIVTAQRDKAHLYDEIKDLIDANQEILIFGHKDADGDTLGCSLAFSEALRSQGKDVWVLVPPPLPPMYAFLPGFEDIQAEPPHGIDPQLVFFFDSGNLERSGSGVRRIASHATLVNIDHHPSNSRFGDINII